MMAQSAKQLCPISRFISGLAVICSFSFAPLSAQEVLPRPDPKFNGVIGQTYKDSTPDKIPLVKAPAGAPNVLLIPIDDSGFGQWSTFGGQVPTPNLDRLAQEGLSYTRFHTTALCSPTRAALLTGRNHHSAATGVITELGSGYPGYSGQVPKSEAMGAEILRQNGYSTAFFGKNHNIADWETRSPALSIAGRDCRVSIISTASSAARPTNGSPPSIREPSRSRWRCPRAARPTTP